MADNRARFECNVILKMSKKGDHAHNHNYYVKKVKKKLDNNGKFELNISQFYVFQGKKKQNHTY